MFINETRHQYYLLILMHNLFFNTLVIVMQLSKSNFYNMSGSVVNIWLTYSLRTFHLGSDDGSDGSTPRANISVIDSGQYWSYLVL